MERELVEWLRRKLLPTPAAPLGLWDDAALLPAEKLFGTESPVPESSSSAAAPPSPRDSGRGLIATVDTLTDGVDFRLSEVSPRRIGRKALAVNLSDLAAMAGVPRAALVSLVLPRSATLEFAQALYEGMFPLADQFGLAIVGGDTNSWADSLAITVTALGNQSPHGTLRRDAARPGDAILVTGTLGGSILGKHFDFVPRVAEALLLVERYGVQAGLDVSDGLLLDLHRLVSTSGCGATLALERVPIAPAAEQLAETSGRTPLEHALSDGEDFELLLAAPPQVAERLLAEQPLEVPLSCLGHCTAEPGLWTMDAAGSRRAIEPRGYEHRFGS